jgi:undecaprenyl-diphosphatase
MLNTDKLVMLDQQLSARLRATAGGPGWLRRAAIVLAHSGDSPIWIVGLLLVIWLGPPFWRHQAWLAFVGVWVAAVAVQLLKIIFHRQRPAGEWGQGYRRLDPHSFPSGHAARVFMLAAVAVALGPVAWASLMLIWASLVSLARVVMGVHYLSDVVVGAGLGVVCGVGVVLALGG